MSAPLVAGDTRPTRLVYENNGEPVNITGYTITIKLGYATPVSRVCTIVDAVNGVFEVPWQSGDLVAGNIPCEILVRDGSAKEKTHKMGTLAIVDRII
jgi:hypothetical protein